MMPKPVVFLTRADYPEIAVQLLKNAFEVVCWSGKNVLSKPELIENIKGKYALLCAPGLGFSIDKDVINVADKLKVVSTFSVGYDHLNVQDIKAKGIRIGYTPDVLTESVAEHAITLLLASGRRLLETHNTILKGEWTAKTWAPLWMCGRGLDGSNVGILGYGRIGHSIAQKLKVFNVARIHYFSRRQSPQAQELGAEFTDIDEIMKTCDFIIVALSLSEETKGIVNKDRINMMKSTAVIVNIGRGGLIDQKALTEALSTKKIFGAGLDVFEPEPLALDDPILKLDNAVCTPHTASATVNSRVKMAKLAAENILAVLNNERMPAEL